MEGFRFVRVKLLLLKQHLKHKNVLNSSKNGCCIKGQVFFLNGCFSKTKFKQHIQTNGWYNKGWIPTKHTHTQVIGKFKQHNGCCNEEEKTQMWNKEELDPILWKTQVWNKEANLFKVGGT